MIRTMQPIDLNAIMDIWLNNNISAHSYIPKDHWLNNFTAVKEAIASAEVTVYEESNVIKGFVGIVDNYIAGIFIRDDIQSKGIGTMLIKKCKLVHETLTLHVYVKNTKAVQFYKRNSFQIIDEKLDTITNESEYYMEWRRNKEKG